MPPPQKIQDLASAKGVTVVRCASSGEALSAIATGSLQRHRALPPCKFRMISNRSRLEGGVMDAQAGLKFAQQSRLHGCAGSVCVLRYQCAAHSSTFPPSAGTMVLL